MYKVCHDGVEPTIAVATSGGSIKHKVHSQKTDCTCIHANVKSKILAQPEWICAMQGRKHMFLHSMCQWLFKERKQRELASGSELVSVFGSACRALIHLALWAACCCSLRAANMTSPRNGVTELIEVHAGGGLRALSLKVCLLIHDSDGESDFQLHRSCSPASTLHREQRRGKVRPR